LVFIDHDGNVCKIGVDEAGKTDYNEWEAAWAIPKLPCGY